MAEQKIVLEFTEQQIRDLDAMVTEGWRVLREDVANGSAVYQAALAIVHRIDANRRALLDGKHAPDAAPEGPTRMDLQCRIDDALSWIDEPDDATPEQQLAKIRAVLDNGRLGGRARCGSCTDDDVPRAPFVPADQAFPEEKP